jgi:hypothetical protein
MRILAIVSSLLMLAACFPEKQPVEKKAEAPPEPVGAQKAFFRTLPSARTWAPDVEPLRVESLAIPEVKWGEGKYGAWRITYVSAAKQRLKVYTYSVAESPGNVYKDVFSPLEERWNGPSGQTLPFRMQAFKIESDKAWAVAIEKSAAYLAKKSNQPAQVLLEWNKRFSQPSYRIFWGNSIGTAEHSVFVDAVTGQFLTKVP